jgi:hypothetical protein
MRAPVPVLAVLASLVALFAFGITFGEAFVGRIGTARHDHDGRSIGDEDHTNGPGGLAIASQGYVLRPRATRFTAGEYENFRFTVFTDRGDPVTNFARLGERQMSLIVVRRDMSNYQRLYPTMDPDGTWMTPLELDEPGNYRAFAEFLPWTAKTPVTLGVDLDAPGFVEPAAISKESTTAKVGSYTVAWTGNLIAGTVSRVGIHVMRDGLPVTDLDPIIGGGARLFILREGDLASLQVHPVGGPRQDTAVNFDVEVPTAGYYRMFLEFQHHGLVRTVEFTGLAR